MIEFRILGTVSVRQDGIELLAGRRQTITLAVLLDSLHSVVPDHHLEEAIWGPDDRRGDSTLRVTLGRLRKQLAGECEITRTDGGYRLSAEDFRLDSSLFLEAIEKISTVPIEDRLEHYDAALSLWRGEPYQGLESVASLVPTIRRLTNARMLAIEERFECALTLGQHRDLIDSLERFVSKYPTNERLACALTTSLLGSGQRNEGLAVLRRLRANLVDELGINPSPETLALELRCLRGTDERFEERLRRVSTDRFSHDTRQVLRGRPTKSTIQTNTQRFFGRAEERRRLIEAIRWTTSGDGGVAIVCGPSGSGKTSLIRSAIRETGSSDTPVLRTSCTSQTNQPFAAICELLSPIVEQHVFHDLSGDERTALASVFPEVEFRLGSAVQSPVLQPLARLALVQRGLSSLLRLATREPTSLIVDDLQWIDVESFTVLSEWMATAPQVVLICGTRNPPGADDHGQLLENAPGLSREEVQQWVASERKDLPRRVCEQLASEIRHRTNGQPILVRALLSEVDENGLLRKTRLTEFRNEPVLWPKERLAEDQIRVLGTCALIDRPFSLELIEEVEPGKPAPETLRLAEDLGIIEMTPNGLFVIHHALVRDQLVDEIPRSERRRLHHRIAEVLVRHEAPASLIAEHLEAALPLGSLEETIETLRAAAVEQSAQLQSELTVRTLGRALLLVSYIESPQRRNELAFDLRLLLARAWAELGDAPRSSEQTTYAYELAESMKSAERMARAAIGVEIYGVTATADRERIRRLQTSLGLLDLSDPNERLLAARISCELLAELDHSPQWRHNVEVALKLVNDAELPGMQPSKPFATWALVKAADGFYSPDEHLRISADALDAAQGAKLANLELDVRFTRLRQLLTKGSIEEACDELQTFERRGFIHGRSRDNWIAKCMRASLFQAQGDRESFLQMQQGALEAGLAGGLEDAWGALATSVFVDQFLAGNVSELSGHLGQHAEAYPDIPAWSIAYALSLAHRGDLVDARALLRKTVGMLPKAPRAIFWLAGVTMAAEAAFVIHDRDIAANLQTLLHEADGCVFAVTSVAIFGPLDLARSRIALVIDSHSSAIKYAQRAKEQSAIAGFRAWQSRCDDVIYQTNHSER
jgi:DNA-binding SARP family transcriptional activator